MATQPNLQHAPTPSSLYSIWGRPNFQGSSPISRQLGLESWRLNPNACTPLLPSPCLGWHAYWVRARSSMLSSNLSSPPECGDYVWEQSCRTPQKHQNHRCSFCSLNWMEDFPFPPISLPLFFICSSYDFFKLGGSLFMKTSLPTNHVPGNTSFQQRTVEVLAPLDKLYGPVNYLNLWKLQENLFCLPWLLQMRVERALSIRRDPG